MPSCIYSTEYDVINRVSYFLWIYNMSGDSQHALVCIYCTSSVMVFMQCSLLGSMAPYTYVFCVSFNFDVGRKPITDMVTSCP